MRKLPLALAALGIVAAAGPASAQKPTDLVRFQWITGFLNQGSMADVDFALDTSGQGGPVIVRSDGTLDVDPAVWYGARGTYRLNPRVSISASWMHSRGRYRVQFPALASIDGNFDLEGLILATEDFINQAEPDVRAESAMGDALSDVYLASVSYEFPMLKRRALPYVSLGAGIFTQRSEGAVLQLSYETAVPSRIQTSESLGFTLETSGLSVFGIDQTNWALSFGGGIRVALSKRWGADLQIQDIVRMNPDLTYLDAKSTPPPDLEQGRFFSTSWVGTDSPIHSFGIRVGIEYALWPYGEPR